MDSQVNWHFSLILFQFVTTDPQFISTQPFYWRVIYGWISATVAKLRYYFAFKVCKLHQFYYVCPCIEKPSSTIYLTTVPCVSLSSCRANLGIADIKNEFIGVTLKSQFYDTRLPLQGSGCWNSNFHPVKGSQIALDLNVILSSGCPSAKSRSSQSLSYLSSSSSSPLSIITISLLFQRRPWIILQD